MQKSTQSTFKRLKNQAYSPLERLKAWIKGNKMTHKRATFIINYK